MKKTLVALREKIDAIDEELLHMLGKRFALVREIGKIKKGKDMNALDKKRWQEVLQRIETIAKKQNMPAEVVKKIYTTIHKASLFLEKKS